MSSEEVGYFSNVGTQRKEPWVILQIILSSPEPPHFCKLLMAGGCPAEATSEGRNAPWALLSEPWAVERGSAHLDMGHLFQRPKCVCQHGAHGAELWDWGSVRSKESMSQMLFWIFSCVLQPEVELILASS